MVKGILIASLTVTDVLPRHYSVILTLGQRNKVSPHTQSPGQTCVSDEKTTPVPIQETEAA